MKKTLALIVAFALLVCLVPMTVSALPNSFTINKLSGGTFTEKDLIGDIPTVMIFGQLDDEQSCMYTNYVVDSYVGDFSGTDKIHVILADITGANRDEVKKYAECYDCETFMTVCYGGACYDLLWAMVRQYGSGSSGVTTPYTVIFDKNGNSVGTTCGAAYTTQLSMLASVDSSINPYASCNLTFTGKQRYKDAHGVFELVNKERAKAGLPALTEDNNLSDFAMKRAAECAVTFSHNRPNGESCFSALLSREYRINCGENIAYSFSGSSSTPEEIMGKWMNSEGHRANILGENFISVGIGCFEINGYVYWTQFFSGWTFNKVLTEYPVAKNATYKVETNMGILRLLADTKGNTGYLQVGKSAQFDLCHYNTITGGKVPLDPGAYGVSTSSNCVTVNGNTVTAKSAGNAIIEYYITKTDSTEKAAGVSVKLRVGKEEKPTRNIGDIDGDGKVNVQDSLILKRIIVGNAAVNKYREYGDVNGDGKVNASDSLLLRKIIVGKI